MLSLSPKGGSKTQNGRFPSKIALKESLPHSFFLWILLATML